MSVSLTSRSSGFLHARSDFSTDSIIFQQLFLFETQMKQTALAYTILAIQSLHFSNYYYTAILIVKLPPKVYAIFSIPEALAATDRRSS